MARCEPGAGSRSPGTGACEAYWTKSWVPGLLRFCGEPQDPEFQGLDDRLGAIRDPQLGDYVPHVNFGGGLADKEALGDLLVRLPLGHEPQHL